MKSQNGGNVSTLEGFDYYVTVFIKLFKLKIAPKKPEKIDKI